MHFSHFPILLIVTTLAATASPATQPDLPVHVASSAGRTLDAKSRNVGNSLVISGSVRPPLRTLPSHVDVELIGADGNVLANASTALRSYHPRISGGTRQTFSASFPARIAGEARQANVTLRTGPHSQCSAQ